MAAVLMVKGTIQYGRLKEFSETVASFLECRRSKGWAVPEVLYGLSGPMNAVVLLFRYADLAGYEREILEAHKDTEYLRIASQMPYLEGSIAYELYHH